MARSSADKKIVRDFKRHHGHGYKVVRVVHNDFTPYVGVWYLTGKTATGWSSGGAAFYLHGRHARPKNSAAYFVGPAPHYVVTVDGTGTWDKAETITDSEGSTSLTTSHVEYHWRATYGTSRRPVSLRRDEDLASTQSASLTGSVSYRQTSNPPSPDDTSCTGTLSGPGPTQIYWRPSHGKTRFDFDLGDMRGSSSDSNCSDISPLDPSGDGTTTADPSFDGRITPASGRGVDRGNVIWRPFTGSPALHHAKHESNSENGTYAADTSVSVSGTARFDLVGLGG
jgi:hypothetical protein